MRTTPTIPTGKTTGMGIVYCSNFTAAIGIPIRMSKTGVYPTMVKMETDAIVA